MDEDSVAVSDGDVSEEVQNDASQVTGLVAQCADNGQVTETAPGSGAGGSAALRSVAPSGESAVSRRVTEAATGSDKSGAVELPSAAMAGDVESDDSAEEASKLARLVDTIAQRSAENVFPLFYQNIR